MKAKPDIPILLIITAILLCLYSYICEANSYSDIDDTFTQNNGNAKLTFTNTSTVIIKYNIKYNKDFPDGIYSGSLNEPVSDIRSLYEQDYKLRLKQLDAAEYTDHYDYLHTYMNFYMGEKIGSGYYCTVIIDNSPIASYWSRTSVVADYSEQLGIIAQTDADEFGHIKGHKFGAYPKENRSSYDAEISLDHSGNTLPLYYDPHISSSGAGIHDNYTFYFTYLMKALQSPVIFILIVLIILLILRIIAVKKKE